MSNPDGRVTRTSAIVTVSQHALALSGLSCATTIAVEGFHAVTLIRDHDEERQARIEYQMELARRAQMHAEQSAADAKEKLAAAQAALKRAQGRLRRAATNPKADRIHEATSAEGTPRQKRRTIQR